MKASLVLLLSLFAAAPARAQGGNFHFLDNYGTKQHPPKCALPKGLKKPPLGKADDVMCGDCGGLQGVLPDGYCGVCPSGEGILPSRACGKCKPNEVVNKDYRCEDPVAKAEADKKAKEAAQAAEKAAAEKEAKRKADEKAYSDCVAKCPMT